MLALRALGLILALGRAAEGCEMCSESTERVRTDAQSGAVFSAGRFCLTVGPTGDVTRVCINGTSVLSPAAAVPFVAISGVASDRGFTINNLAQPAGVNTDCLVTLVRETDTVTMSINVSTVQTKHGDVVIVLAVGKIMPVIALGESASLDFVRLAVNLGVVAQDLAAAYTNTSSGAGFALALVPVDLPTTVSGVAWGGVSELVASLPLQSEAALEGSRVALWGGFRQELISAVQSIEVTFGLPHPTIDGVFAKQSPAVRKGYFLIDVNETSLPDAITYAEASGMPYITMLYESWTESCGHYNVSASKWPHGLASAIGTIHSHGLKVGIHTLSANINTNDRYIQPTPDRRLATLASLTLAVNINASASTFIEVVENTSALPMPYGALVADVGQDLLIDDEIITYTTVNSSVTPFGLRSVKRGQYGTTATDHTSGTKLYKLAAHRADNAFLPSVTLADRSLVDEIGQRLAEVVDTFEIDMIYFDGLQSMGTLAPIHYASPLVQRSFSQHVVRDVLVESSDTHPYNWHLNTRAGQTDWAATDSRAFMDFTKARSERATRDMLMPCDMGWWGFELYNPAFYATTPDELEYMAARATGWQANPNLETTIASLRGNGRTMEGLAKLKPWTTLSLSEQTNPDILASLRLPDMDYSLESDSQTAWIHPSKVHPRTIVENCSSAEPCAWSFPRVFPTSSDGYKIRVRALPQVSEVNGILDVLQLASTSIVRTTQCTGDISSVPIPHFATLRAVQSKSTMHVKVRPSPTGNLSLWLNYSASSLNSVGCYRQRYKPNPINLTAHRPLQVAVYGDGSGATLCLQLEDDGAPFFRSFFINITWEGWRTVRLDVAATRLLFDYPQIPMPSNPNMAMRNFNFGQVLGLNVYVTNAFNASIYVGSVDALQEVSGELQSVTVQLSSQEQLLRVRGALRSSPPDYFECEDVSNASSCRFFDANGFPINGVATTELLPDLPRITNSSADASISVSLLGDARAEVVIVEKSSDRLGPIVVHN